MKAVFALALLSVGGKLRARPTTAQQQYADTNPAFAAPAPDAGPNHNKHLNDLVARSNRTSSGEGRNTTYWWTYTTDDVTEACRSDCSSTIDMINCLTKADAQTYPLSNNIVGQPKVGYGNIPSLGSTKDLGKASQTCYKDDICPKLNEYAVCMQCIADKEGSLQSIMKEPFVNNTNKDMAELKPFCESVGTAAANYTQLVINGARTTAAAGSFLIAFGVAVASFL